MDTLNMKCTRSPTATKSGTTEGKVIPMTEVEYKKEMPVDEFNRPGGMLSLSDLPIKAFKILTRKGTVQKYDRHKGTVWVKDTETGISVDVPFNDVKLIKTQENEDV